MKNLMFGCFALLLLGSCDGSGEPKSSANSDNASNVSPGKEQIIDGADFYLTSDDGKNVWSVFKVEGNLEIPKGGYLWTNIDTHYAPHSDVIAIPYPTPIYDISFINYSSSFAKRYGYPTENVVELPKGMDLIEFSIKTEGSFLVCRLNFLLDSGQNLFFPDEKFHKILNSFNSHFGVPLRLPMRVEGFEENPEDIDYRMNKRQWLGSDGEDKFVLRNVFLAGNYNTDKKETGFRLSLFLEAYYPGIYQGLDYVSVNLGCGEIIRNGLKSDTPQIWFKREGGPDYRKELKINSDDFVKYFLPREIIEKIVPLLQDEKVLNVLKTRLTHDYFTPEETIGQSYYYFFDNEKDPN